MGFLRDFFFPSLFFFLYIFLLRVIIDIIINVLIIIVIEMNHLRNEFVDYWRIVEFFEDCDTWLYCVIYFLCSLRICLIIYIYF